MTSMIMNDKWGTYLEVYDDSDGGSGYGDNPRIGRWYGTHEECAAIDPRKVKLYPLTVSGGVDEFDLACERRHD